MTVRPFRNKKARREFLRGLFHRASEGKTLYFEGENPNEQWDTFSYDGKVLTMFNADPFNELHEMCHHLLATPERREEINWGLGGSPFQSKKAQPMGAQLPVAPVTQRREWADEEEVDSCIFHLALAKLLGCGEKSLKAEMHSLNRWELPTLLDIEDLETRYRHALPEQLWLKLKACHV